jgi:hypothetical protein
MLANPDKSRYRTSADDHFTSPVNGVYQTLTQHFRLHALRHWVYRRPAIKYENPERVEVTKGTVTKKHYVAWWPPEEFAEEKENNGKQLTAKNKEST